MFAKPERYNIYGVIHKALRAFMSHTLVRTGSTDWSDLEDRTEALEQVRALLDMCRTHLDHENRFVHVAMEARATGSTTQTGEDHVGHVSEITACLADVAAVECASSEVRARLGFALYQRLALFVAENFEHMAFEETHNNAVLWAHYSDAEILAIEAGLRADILPAETGQILRWMLPAVGHPERAAMLLEMRAGMPAEVFAGVLSMAGSLISPRDRAKLQRSLEAANFAVAA